MPIINPTIETYKEFATREEGKSFRDYLFQMCLTGDDGNDYFANFAVGRSELFDMAMVIFTKEPVWFSTTPTSKVLCKGHIPLFENREFVPVGELKTEMSDSAVTVSLKGVELVCTPPTYRMTYQSEKFSLDLEAESLGLPFWFNQGKEEGMVHTPSSTPCHGIELFAEVSGTMTLEGKEIKVKGTAVHEHLIAFHTAWMEFGFMDWIWFVTEDLYALLFHMHGGGYKDGGIYLRKEKEYLVVNDLDIDHTQWACFPKLQHNFPISLLVRAKTDQGTLLIKGDCVRTIPWDEVDKYNQTTAAMAGADIEMRYSGNFTYNDGREITLNNARGADEVIIISNFAQRSYL